jgi:L1 cell adhesion molecule like protein
MGFKVVGDNIDKNIRPSFQCSERQTKSLHYFHSFAIKDRVDLHNCSDDAPQNTPIDSSTLLPLFDDIAQFRSDAVAR